MDGILVGVFGTEAEPKAALLTSLGKKSEAEGMVIYHRTEAGRRISLLDDQQFPQRIQGYARVASLSDQALFMFPRSGRLGAADGELAVLLEGFSLRGTIEVVEGSVPPESVRAALKGTAVGGYPIEERNLQSTVLDPSWLAPRGDSPKGTLVYVDRAFTVKGIGTVALGFVLSGKVSVHDELRPMPGKEGLRADVKSIQINDEDYDSAGTGIRVGLSLKGVEPADLDSTHWLDDGSFRTSNTLNLAFAKSPFYKPPVIDREMHIQLPGEMLAATISQGGQPGTLSAKLQSDVPCWEGMRACLIDLNAKNLRVAGGCTCRF
ncbi:MAG TPA: EF-Tu/IF-2/RF-3 family GTPase [Nitrososphaerales archaeon]|nr:EF-Tu/IF-2/RF-3 family GTPase [Nitrososphaerales archaeon]